MFQKYYCIKQHDITDCGAACLATISKQYGFKTSITKIREVAGTDKQGTNAYGVIKAAEQLGFSAKGVKGDKNAFFSEFPLPCIAHVVADGNLLHYVVIHKISKKEVIIADPGKGLVKLKPEEFFGEKSEEGKPPAYQWSGVLMLMLLLIDATLLPLAVIRLPMFMSYSWLVFVGRHACQQSITIPDH